MKLNTKMSLLRLGLAFPFILLVRFYRLVSPIKQVFLGPYSCCRFYPTCSEYALECLSYYSLPKALFKITSRILRCNPMHPGGFDPVMEHKKTKTDDE